MNFDDFSSYEFLRQEESKIFLFYFFLHFFRVTIRKMNFEDFSSYEFGRRL